MHSIGTGSRQKIISRLSGELVIFSQSLGQQKSSIATIESDPDLAIKAALDRIKEISRILRVDDPSFKINCHLGKIDDQIHKLGYVKSCLQMIYNETLIQTSVVNITTENQDEDEELESPKSPTQCAPVKRDLDPSTMRTSNNLNLVSVKRFKVENSEPKTENTLSFHPDVYVLMDNESRKNFMIQLLHQKKREDLKALRSFEKDPELKNWLYNLVESFDIKARPSIPKPPETLPIVIQLEDQNKSPLPPEQLGPKDDAADPKLIDEYEKLLSLGNVEEIFQWIVGQGAGFAPYVWSCFDHHETIFTVLDALHALNVEDPFDIAFDVLEDDDDQTQFNNFLDSLQYRRIKEPSLLKRENKDRFSQIFNSINDASQFRKAVTNLGEAELIKLLRDNICADLEDLLEKCPKIDEFIRETVVRKILEGILDDRSVDDLRTFVYLDLFAYIATDERKNELIRKAKSLEARGELKNLILALEKQYFF